MTKWRALVAEDSAQLLFSMEILLEGSGIEIVGAAATVAQLRQLIETTLADIAILDVNLKGEMVFPAAEMLIERGVPILFTTGYAPENIFPPHLLGLPTLRKPYDPDEFLNLVEKVIVEAKARKDRPEDVDTEGLRV
jgi:DNA-binding response OmpR family regulator